MKASDLFVKCLENGVEYSPKNRNSDLRKKIIHIDFTPAEVDTYYPPEVEIDADVEYTMDAILEELEKEKDATVKSSEEFPKILEEAKKSKDKPVIIAVDVDHSRNKLLLHDDFET